MFVSGFGLAYALEKHRDFGRYYARRLARILPSYYVYTFFCFLVGCVYACFGRPFDIGQYWLDRLMPINVWFNVPSGRWYVSAALWYSALAALLYPLSSGGVASSGCVPPFSSSSRRALFPFFPYG